jgi:hypothetical protein
MHRPAPRAAAPATRQLGGLRRPPLPEALSLYRDCLRTCRHFHWADARGEPWNAVLRRSTRKEFEQARDEPDPLMVAKMLVVGQECLDKTVRQFEAAQRRIEAKIAQTRTR